MNDGRQPKHIVSANAWSALAVSMVISVAAYLSHTTAARIGNTSALFWDFSFGKEGWIGSSVTSKEQWKPYQKGTEDCQYSDGSPG